MRVDCGVESGATVTPFYDSLLAKIIGFGADREEARRRLVSAIEATFVAGVTTNRDLLARCRCGGRNSSKERRRPTFLRPPDS